MNSHRNSVVLTGRAMAVNADADSWALYIERDGQATTAGIAGGSGAWARVVERKSQFQRLGLRRRRPKYREHAKR
jgi:hypothetical protein